MRFRFLTVLLLAAICTTAFAQVPVEKPSPEASLVSPAYFGPYAFPVPDLLEGEICSRLHLELGGDAVQGRIAPDGDRTGAVTFRATVPLWTDRASISVWGEAHEWYSDSPATRAARRVSDTYALKGNSAGNVYWSLEAVLLRESEKAPSIVLRAATQSATGDKYEVARHYDAPGYFFDLSAGKSFRTSQKSSLRLSATAGFVCWQIDRGAQNDAVLLGAKASWDCPFARFSIQYAGYSGREGKKSPASGDSPSVLNARAEARLGCVSPYIHFQHGLHDWPFTMLGAGVSVDLNIL